MRPLTRFVALCLALLMLAQNAWASQACGATMAPTATPHGADTPHHQAPADAPHHLPCQPAACTAMVTCHAVGATEPTTVTLFPAPLAAIVWPISVQLPLTPPASPEPPPPRA